MPTGGADWPLVGRTEELQLLRRLRSRARSAFISGPVGVGESRLAREALAEADGEGWTTLFIRGGAGLAGVPLGPFRTVFRLPVASDLSELAESVVRELAALRSSKGLMILADDSHNLDDASVDLLHQAISGSLVVAIVTTRTPSKPPAALTEIWKDGSAERVELQNLSRLETSELLAAGLEGSVQDSSASRIWHVTSGNPLYIREVALSSAESGALQRINGEWRWQGEWAGGVRLQEIVDARLGRLDPDELTAMELLALAGALPLALVSAIATTGAVQRLEERGLVTAEQTGGRLEVSVAHPLHAEVLRQGLPPLRQRSIRRNLVDALTATGARRAADKVRLACWSLESGLEVDPVTLALGADASLFGIDQAIARRLREILPDLASQMPADGPAVSQDDDRAVQMARTAYERGGGLAEGVALASTLAWTGAVTEAEAVLGELAADAGDINDRTRVALGLAWVRFWGRYEVDQARDGLMTAVAEAQSAGADRKLVADLFQDLAGIALNTAQPAAALEYAGRAAAAEEVELALSVAAPAAAAALGYLGRCREALVLVDQALSAPQANGQQLTVSQLLVARAGALSRMGDLEEARQLMEWLRDVALADGLLGATGVFGVVLGHILLAQGRPASAGRILRDSCGLLAEEDPLGYRPWALAGLARASAMSGEEVPAAAALEEAARLQPISRHYDTYRFLAEVELHRAAGRLDEARDEARAGVAWARAAGIIGDEALGLAALLVLEPSGDIADRLGQLAMVTDSSLVGALAEHARALVAADPQALLDASRRLAEMSVWPMAAQAAGEAAAILENRHEARAAKAAARLAAGFEDHCEGIRTSAYDLSSGSIRLTRREREIAVLAASGHSTKEIAERTYLSSRTVENHLYHAFTKLGVTDRASLAAALDPARPAG